jgi:hypothetical protein
MARASTIAPWFLAALLPFAALLTGGAFLGHACVVALAVGIFRATVRMDSGPLIQPGTRRASHQRSTAELTLLR